MPTCADPYPRVRWLQPQLVQVQGETCVALQDAAGLHPQPIVVTPVAYQLIQLMDGTRLRADIVRQARLRFGLQLEAHHLDGLVDQLDEILVLDNSRSRAALEALQPRPAAHAGSAYPDEPGELRAFLDELLDAAPPSSRSRSASAYLIPHIDLTRGRDSYAAAWRDAQPGLGEFDLFVLLGISHAPAGAPFILTRKDFATPLGVVPTAVELVDALARDLPFDPFADEFNHLGEHSIEFQLPFLQHLAPGPFQVLPILCGSFHEWLEEPGWPEEGSPEVSAFLRRLGEVLLQRPRTCWIASVDLAHVGQRFGGPALSEESLQALEQSDRSTLAGAVEGSARRFLQGLQSDRGQRNYCGTSAIYSLLHVLRPGEGKLLHYQQCNEPGLTSTVTVAAVSYSDGR